MHVTESLRQPYFVDILNRFPTSTLAHVGTLRLARKRVRMRMWVWMWRWLWMHLPLQRKPKKGSVGKMKSMYRGRSLRFFNPPTPQPPKLKTRQNLKVLADPFTPQRLSGSAVQQGDETKLPNAGRIHVTDIQMEKKK